MRICCKLGIHGSGAAVSVILMFLLKLFNAIYVHYDQDPECLKLLINMLKIITHKEDCFENSGNFKDLLVIRENRYIIFKNIEINVLLEFFSTQCNLFFL